MRGLFSLKSAIDRVSSPRDSDTTSKSPTLPYALFPSRQRRNYKILILIVMWMLLIVKYWCTMHPLLCCIFWVVDSSSHEQSKTVIYDLLFKGFCLFKCRWKLGYFTIWTGQNKVLIADYMSIRPYAPGMRAFFSFSNWNVTMWFKLLYLKLHNKT